MNSFNSLFQSRWIHTWNWLTHTVFSNISTHLSVIFWSNKKHSRLPRCLVCSPMCEQPLTKKPNGNVFENQPISLLTGYTCSHGPPGKIFALDASNHYEIGNWLGCWPWGSYWSSAHTDCLPHTVRPLRRQQQFKSFKALNWGWLLEKRKRFLMECDTLGRPIQDHSRPTGVSNSLHLNLFQ